VAIIPLDQLWVGCSLSSRSASVAWESGVLSGQSDHCSYTRGTWTRCTI